MSASSNAIEIVLNIVSRGAAQIDQMRGSFDRFTDTLRRSETSLREVSIAASLVAAALGTGLVAAVNTAAKFEATMSEVAAVSGATAVELTAMGDAAKEAGSKTKFSAVEAAEGLRSLAQAGLTSKQAVESLESTLVLAQAGGIKLADAANYATNIMSQFGFEAKDLGQIVDTLATVANASNTGVSEMAMSLSYAGGIGKAAGQKFSEVSAVLAVLADAGFAGERAGTVLRGAMASILKPTKDATAALANLGISTTDSIGRMRQFGDILVDLKTKGATATDIITIFGQESGGGLAAALNKSINRLDEFRSRIDNSAGSAIEMAKVMDDNFRGAITRLSSAFEGLVIAAGEPFLKFLARGTDAVSNFVDGMKKSVEQFGDVGKGLVILTSGFTALIVVVTAFGAAWTLVLRPLSVFALTLLPTIGTGFTIVTAQTGAATAALTAFGITASGLTAIFAGLGGILASLWGVAQIAEFVGVLIRASDVSAEMSDRVEVAENKFLGLAKSAGLTNDSIKLIVESENELAKAVDAVTGASNQQLAAQKKALAAKMNAIEQERIRLEVEQQNSVLAMLGLSDHVTKLNELANAEKSIQALYKATSAELRARGQVGVDESARYITSVEEIKAAEVNLAETKKAIAAAERDLATATEEHRKALIESRAKKDLDAQKTVLDGLKQSLEESLRAEEKYTTEIASLRDSLTKMQVSSADRLREIQRRSMSESAADADLRQQQNEKLLESETALAKSRQALAQGDLESAEKYAKLSKSYGEQAAQLAERFKSSSQVVSKSASSTGVIFGKLAEEVDQYSVAVTNMGRDTVKAHLEESEELERTYNSTLAVYKAKREAEGDYVDDVQMFTGVRIAATKSEVNNQVSAEEAFRKSAKAQEEAQKQLIEIAESRKRAEQESAKAIVTAMSSQEAKIEQLQQKLNSLNGQTAVAKTDVEVSKAMSKLADLKKTLESIERQNGYTAKVYVDQVERRSTGGLAGYTNGGVIPGFGGGDRIPILAERGEMIVNKDRTKIFKDLLMLINYGPLRSISEYLSAGMAKFQTGGIVQGVRPALQKFASGGIVMAVPATTSGSESSMQRFDVWIQGRPVAIDKDPVSQLRGTLTALQEISRGRARP